ncbi:hypothetical protein [Ralstonia phage RSK1]|uniref:Replicative helicase inhibitor G39P N-terminal domain-containing protein n=1 Tax=Ralstonia phage RSK1 TaxID=1417599 RepID=U6C6D0_9CAUD|nr:hypothetical protein X532_gp50 [Ralstonia phage RSK1]BAO04715.1 hypothetical protein [Ralstonia phage RSK1]
MQPTDKGEFVKLLNLCYSTLGRPLPPFESIDLWLTVLRPYSIEQVRGALSEHMRESKFAPVPADVVTRIPSAAKRPGPEEAWAIAVKACDESETVVMNDEIAHAWGVAKPIFDLGDEVGARMAFKEVYERQVATATEPAKWWPSIGTDQHKRDAALSEARRQGLLPAPQVTALLSISHKVDNSEVNPEGIEKIKAFMADMDERRRGQAEAAERNKVAAREAIAESKRIIAKRVSDYDNNSWQSCAGPGASPHTSRAK